MPRPRADTPPSTSSTGRRHRLTLPVQDDDLIAWFDAGSAPTTPGARRLEPFRMRYGTVVATTLPREATPSMARRLHSRDEGPSPAHVIAHRAQHRSVGYDLVHAVEGGAVEDRHMPVGKDRRSDPLAELGVQGASGKLDVMRERWTGVTGRGDFHRPCARPASAAHLALEDGDVASIAPTKSYPP